MDEEGPASAPNLDTLLQQTNIAIQPREIQCCCGQPSCAFLQDNTQSLESLERDLVSAAQIGQALLVRHETHMQEAEEERDRMNATVEKLEADKKQLEAANAQTIEENRNLLDQLEGLNNLVSESDSQIESLTATLRSTQQELQRLTILAGRAASLEMQLTNLEVEQAQLQAQLKTSEEDNRSAIQRWKRAEGTIGHLQDQIDRIEKEAKEERERHVEVLGRLERRWAVEKELDSAAGRLKGAAAVTSLGKYNNGGSNVVSHFVKDILQDNANLQLGIVELREMLMGSNAEAEHLREQLQLHQPLDDGEDQPNLESELTKAEPPIEEPLLEVNRPELHVHHHYHAPEVTVKKSRRKRAVVTSGHFRSGSGASTPRAQRIRDWRSGTPSSAATIISQTSASVPPTPNQHRWSTQSAQTVNSFATSSIPSSPRRTSSIFDNMDTVFDSSQPTTPESSVPGSPVETPTNAKQARKAAYRSISTPTHLISKPKLVLPTPSPAISAGDKLEEFDDPNFSDSSPAPPTAFRLTSNGSGFAGSSAPEPIPEEVENEDMRPTPSTTTTSSYLDELSPTTNRPALRRAASHESLLSVSGMDIHTLRSRPSQLLMSGMGFSPRPSLSPASAALTSSEPIITPEVAMARPGPPRRDMDSGSYTRNLLSQQRYGGAPDSSPGQSATRTPLTRRVGGWVWSKWGVAPSSSPTPSTENLRDKEARDPLAALMRGPGVNQSGPIKGLMPPKPTPSQVVPQNVDGIALNEALAEIADSGQDNTH